QSLADPSPELEPIEYPSGRPPHVDESESEGQAAYPAANLGEFPLHAVGSPVWFGRLDADEVVIRRTHRAHQTSYRVRRTRERRHTSRHAEPRPDVGGPRVGQPVECPGGGSRRFGPTALAHSRP